MDRPPVLRRATVRDLPEILRGERRYMADVEPANAPDWERALDRNLALWIDNLERTVLVDVGDASAGYAMWTVDDDRATVITINVDPAFRRRGLARLLLGRLADDARAGGARLLALGVQEDNPARALYESVGFTRTGSDGDYLRYEQDLTADAPAGRPRPRPGVRP